MSARHPPPFAHSHFKRHSSAWLTLQPWLIPSVFILGLIMVAALIKRHDLVQTQNGLMRDTKRVQQAMHFRLQTNQDFLNSLGYLELPSESKAAQDQFQMRAQYFLT